MIETEFEVQQSVDQFESEGEAAEYESLYPRRRGTTGALSAGAQFVVVETDPPVCQCPTSRSRQQTTEIEREGGVLYGCTPCLWGRRFCRKPIVADDGKCRYIGLDTWYCRC